MTESESGAAFETNEDILAKVQNLEANFDEIPEDARNDLLLRLSEKDEAAGTLGRILYIKFNMISENVRNDVLLKLSKKTDAAIFMVNILDEYFDRLPENLRNELLLKFSKNDKFVSSVEQIVSTNFDKIPEDIQSKISENIRTLFPFQTTARRPVLTRAKPAGRKKVDTSKFIKGCGKINYRMRTAPSAPETDMQPPKPEPRFKKAMETKYTTEWGSNKRGSIAKDKITDKKTKYLRLGYTRPSRKIEKPIARAAPPDLPKVESTEAVEKASLKTEDSGAVFDMMERRRLEGGVILMDKDVIGLPIDRAVTPSPISEVLPAEPRYADFNFIYAEGSKQGREVPKGHTLQTGQEYQLEVTVRAKAKGIPVKGERKPVSEPGQEQNVTLMVTATAEHENYITINDPVQTLILPPRGDSIENAIFHVTPLKESDSKNNLTQITIRLYYEFNLIEVVTIYAEVVGGFDDPTRSRLGLDEPFWLEQERRELEYEKLDGIIPRDMHIDITKHEEGFLFTFSFYKSPEEKMVLSAPATLTTDDLEYELKNIREAWYKIAMGETFARQLEGDYDFVNMVRLLALYGSNLWTKLFYKDSNSSIFKIGEWLKSHPVKKGGIVQVSLNNDAAGFIFPWALLYDRDLPRKINELPDMDGFWGMRYCIEHQLPKITKPADKPVKVGDKLKIGFMLVDEFPNANEEKSMMESLKARSSGRLEVTPPITVNDECYNLLRKCDAHILYFYAHGYTQYNKADIGVGKELEFIKNVYESLDENSPQREKLRKICENIKKNQNKFEPKDSWIELSDGRLYLQELYRNILKLENCPLVILNMCESAQIIPSLSFSFIDFFLNRGARSVIGTECPMTIKFAHPFAEKFLGDMLRGERIGVALLNARRYFIGLKNPLGLAYTLFGSATVCFEPPVLQ